jgi:chemotaxis protein MotB
MVMSSSFRTSAPDAVDHSASWLIIFSDVIALMLAFFVMLFATQAVETGGWQAMVQSLSQSLRVDRLQAKHASAAQNVEQRDLPPAIDLSYLQTLIEGMREADTALADVMMTREDDRLIISIPGDLLFDAGRADPTPRAEPRIRLFAELFRNLSNRIDVLGHADSRPVLGQVFESNRELSLARAETVTEMLRGAGYRRRVGAFGMGDAFYGDLAGIAAPEVRDRFARRVDIIVRPEAEWRR